MTKEEEKSYRDLYKIISDEAIMRSLNAYFTPKAEVVMKKLRSKQELYDVGHCNGQLDAYNQILNLKSAVMSVLQNIGA